MPPEYDAVIAGGGLVGASLACALRGSGLRLALIEAVPFAAGGPTGDDDRGLALAEASRRILEGIGLWDRMLPTATPILHIHVSDRGRFGFTRLVAADFGVPALGHVCVARELGRVLMAALTGNPDCEFICPATVMGITTEAGAAHVTIRSDGEERTLACRLIVAADGGQSKARGYLNVGAREHDYRQTAIVANVTPSRPHRNTAYERFTESGPLAVMPQGGQRCGVVCAVKTGEAESTLSLPDGEFLARLQQRFGRRLGEFTRIGRRSAYPLRLIVAERIAGPRFVILGNAAHAIHPNAAQGLNLGLRDVATLAELLHDCARRGGDPGAAEVTARFAAVRRADHRRTICLSDGLARLFCNDLLPLVCLRDLAMLAVDGLPPLKRALVRAASGLTGPAPRLVRGLPL